MSLRADPQERKRLPMARGLLDYFPSALAEVANTQHNGPESEMHWARGKSSDHADCIVRHLVDRGSLDTDGLSHTAKIAWRALALLQEELEAAGATPGRASKFASTGRRRTMLSPDGSPHDEFFDMDDDGTQTSVCRDLGCRPVSK